MAKEFLIQSIGELENGMHILYIYFIIFSSYVSICLLSVYVCFLCDMLLEIYITSKFVTF